MSNIFLKWFGGMIPRMGEQNLKKERMAETGFFPSGMQPRSESLAPRNVNATEAANVNLYSGELRPLTKPARAHEFARPGDDDFYAPTWDDPSYPPDSPETPGKECIPPNITDPPVFVDYELGQQAAYSVITEGSTPLQYQWFLDGILVPSEVGPAFTFLVTEENIHSRVMVGVGNACGNEATVPIAVSNAA